MSADLPSCPSCASKQIVKNGKIHNGKQNHKCRDCGRQFVQDPKKKVINQETKNLIDKLLLEKIPLAGIARVTDVCERSAKGATHVRASDSLRLASPGGLASLKESRHWLEQSLFATRQRGALSAASRLCRKTTGKAFALRVTKLC